jgi:hypothetical protein
MATEGTSMTTSFRQARDEGLRSLYDTFIRAGLYRKDAIEAVWQEQKDKYGLSYIRVERICCRWKAGQPKDKEKGK